jgi:Integrase core domain
MADRSSRSHHAPRRTPALVVRRIVHLRWAQRLGPAQIAAQVGLAPSTVHAVLVRCRISRLGDLDRATGQPVRRYEHSHPGDLVHVDVKKLGNIPAGGATGSWAAPPEDATASRPLQRPTQPLPQRLDRPWFIHAAVDDHSRLASAEIHPDQTQQIAAGFLTRARPGSPTAAWSSSGC